MRRRSKHPPGGARARPAAAPFERSPSAVAGRGRRRNRGGRGEPDRRDPPYGASASSPRAARPRRLAWRNPPRSPKQPGPSACGPPPREASTPHRRTAANPAHRRRRPSETSSAARRSGPASRCVGATGGHRDRPRAARPKLLRARRSYRCRGRSSWARRGAGRRSGSRGAEARPRCTLPSWKGCTRYGPCLARLAQLDRASASGAEGQGFESLTARTGRAGPGAGSAAGPALPLFGASGDAPGRGRKA